MNYKDKTIHYLNSRIILGLLIVGGLMVAFLSTHIFGRIDLTETNQFSISPATQSILKNLDDPINIRVYFSKKLPPGFLQTERYVKDILSEYQAYSKKHLQIRYLDPSQPDIAKEALSYGIPQLQMNVYTKDKFEVQAGYLGLAVVYEDRFEALPVIENIANLEYDLTSAIRKVATAEVKTIGFLTGHGEAGIASQDEGFKQVKKAVEKNYRTKTINLDTENVLEGIDTLIVAGPRDDISDEHLLAIDQFMIKGGKTLFLIDKIDIDLQLAASVMQSNFDDFLANLGVKPESQLVLDQINENAPFTQGYTTYIMPYPFWVKLVAENFALNLPIMNRLSSLVLPWGSPLTIQPVEGMAITELAKTSPESAVQNEPFDVNPGNQARSAEKKSSIPMIAMVSGNYTSYFKEKDVKKGDDFIENSLTPIQSIIVGNSRFAEDNFVSRYPQNLNFFMNAVDYLTLDSSLMDIRAKTGQDRSIGEMSDNMKTLVKFFSIYFVPILVIIIGIIRAYWLKKLRKLHIT